MTGYLILLAKIDVSILGLAAVYAMVWATTDATDDFDDKLLGVAAWLWAWHVRILLAPFRVIHRFARSRGSYGGGGR